MAAHCSTTLRSDTCAFHIERRGPGLLVLRIEGHDVGEFGPLPMRCLEALMPDERIVDLFVDARATRGATMSVSNDWALWLGQNRDRFAAIHMLPGSKYVQVTADFVRRFSGLEDRMRVHGSATEFDAALGAAAPE